MIKKNIGTKKKASRPNQRMCIIQSGSKATIGFFVRYISEKLHIDRDEAEDVMRNNIDKFDIIQIGLAGNIGYSARETIVLKTNIKKDE